MALTAKELRIGNYIYCKGGIIKVTLIGYYGVQSSINGTTINAKFNTPDLEPIPLTEQWLLDFGAKEYLGSKRGFKYSRFDFFYQEDYKYWHVTDFDNETYLTKIEFVHEFQNFIFIMDGEELTKK